MEFRVFPSGFSIAPVKMPQPDGTTVDAMQITIVDVSGQAVHAAFALSDWEMFRRAAADPVGEAEREKARARIAAPNGMAPALGKPRRNR